jgi:methionyl-tRNA formyltransferase
VRTVYLGTSDFAATVLRRLADSPHRPALVVTPPDRRQGRGRKVKPPPAALAAQELGLELAQAENVNEEGALERIRAAKPEAVVVCAFGQLIREPLLSELPILNVHPSLLPRWRGAAPIERAIMAGDERTGVCIMRLTEGLDSGPVALVEETPIGLEDDFEALSARLAEFGGDLLVRSLDLQAERALEFSDQPEEGVTYAEKIEPGERRLDPERPAVELAAKVRALNPHYGTYLEMPDGERLGVSRAHAVEDDLDAGKIDPGRLEARYDALLFGCRDGALQLEVVQPPGGKAMAADAYLRGHPLPGS